MSERYYGLDIETLQKVLKAKKNLEDKTITHGQSYFQAKYDIEEGGIALSEIDPLDVPAAGTKHDSDKSSMALIPQDVLLDVGEVLGFGAKKYSQYNWTKGFAYTRLASAVLRHIAQWLSGQDKDPETGKSHLAHALCGLLMLAAHEKRGLGTDDRDPTSKK